MRKAAGASVEELRPTWAYVLLGKGRSSCAELYFSPIEVAELLSEVLYARFKGCCPAPLQKARA